VDLLKDLNEEQKEMVLSGEGPVLVLAGAGSGKTKALTHRIAYLIDQGTKPENILAITFTNKAAGEMKSRVEKLIANSKLQTPPPRPTMGTFHSICAQILRKEGPRVGISPSFVIFDTEDSKKVIKKSIEKLKISDKVSPFMVKNYISKAKNELIDDVRFEAEAESYKEQQVVPIYKEYQRELKKNDAVDFDDLLFLVVKLFQENPEVLEKYQNIWKYILIDEYQDTNHAQYLFAKMLASEHRNLCVVGDDWQSIYAFRGANFQNILDFEKDYKEAKVIRLEKNYRSTKSILSAAQSVIEKNEKRSTKKLWTENDGGDPITIYEAGSEIDEANFVANEIENLNSKGISSKDIAVFYRTNAQSRTFEEQFMRSQMPYKIVGGVRFYERKEIKDILAWLRVVAGTNDWIAFERSVSTPNRGIGKVSFEKIREYSESNNVKIKDLMNSSDLTQVAGPKAATSLTDYFERVLKIKKKLQSSTSEAVELAIKVSGLAEFYSDGTFQNEERVENLKEFVSVVKELELARGEMTLDAFLEEVALVADIDSLEEGNEGVTLMTLHNSKGLEFKVAFIVGLEENIFPHANSLLDPAEIEEERRLFYVGMTRAMKHLYLIHARKRMYFGKIQSNQPSRFIAEIPPNLLSFEGGGVGQQNTVRQAPAAMAGEFKVGDKVEHEFFGKGKVISVEDDEITADFNVYGKKTVSVSYAPIRKI
jgi:DNA helicase-2/ATP-dependent DNA helicase PcrA